MGATPLAVSRWMDAAWRHNARARRSVRALRWPGRLLTTPAAAQGLLLRWRSVVVPAAGSFAAADVHYLRSGGARAVVVAADAALSVVGAVIPQPSRRCRA